MNENNIISYKPDLNIHGNITTSVKGISNKTSSIFSIKYKETATTTRSVTCNNFVSYSPATTVDRIVEVLNNVNKFLSIIENNDFENKYETEYFSSKDEDEQKSILEDNKNDAEYGSNVLEAYSYMKQMCSDLNNILNLYMKCVFGDNVDKSEVSSIIKNYINQIEGYEAKEEYSKVNYASLYYDTKISYILSDFTSQLDNICYDLSVINNTVKEISSDNAMYELIKKYFDIENNTLNANIYRANNCNNDVIVALKNVYLEKQNLINSLDAFTKIAALDEGKELVSNIQKKIYNNIDNKVSNLIKTCMNYNISYGDISSSLVSKANCRNFL